MELVCDELQINYEDIKDKLPKDDGFDIDAASEALAATPIDEQTGNEDIEPLE